MRRQLSTERALIPDSTEATDHADPIEKAEHHEPTEPIENAEPTLPIEQTEPFEPMDRIESCDHRLHLLRLPDRSMQPPRRPERIMHREAVTLPAIRGNGEPHVHDAARRSSSASTRPLPVWWMLSSWG